MNHEPIHKTREELEAELSELRLQLEEANETIEAIRTGQIDALVVQSDNGHQLYTLKSADHTYRVFIEKMAEGAVTLSQDGLILYCNSQLAQMIGKPLSEVIGASFESLIETGDRYTYQQLFNEGWIQDCKGELFLSAPEQNIPVQLSLTTLELDEGTSLSIIITDLSTQKKNQELLHLKNQQLERSNKALETSNHELQQFASIASHDLQEPLRKIQIFSSRMQEEAALLPPPLPVYLKKVVDSAARMKSLIIDILNYSKLSADNENIESTDINEVLDALLTDFDLLIEERQAQLTIDPIPCLMVNKGQIRQVFQNLISNALKFTRKEQAPIIHIHAVRVAEHSFESPEDEKGPYCVISIQDNGIGFDEKYVNSVFSLFKRLNTAEQYEGSGIGMAIAKKIIEKNGGLITATSVVGSGSCFKILLPVA